MKLVDMTVKSFINELASNSPAPGGGSVSALSAANGAGLMVMAGALTVGKKKFKALDEDVQAQFKNAITFFEESKERFIKYIDQDTDAFNMLMDAFKLPKESEEERNIRSSKIQIATMETIRIPLEVCELCLKTMEKIEDFMVYANKNTISDQGVGGLMLYAALEGASMNVLINLPGLSDSQLVSQYKERISFLKEEGLKVKESILSKVTF